MTRRGKSVEKKNESDNERARERHTDILTYKHTKVHKEKSGELDHQMSPSKSKCWHKNNCLHFLKRVVQLLVLYQMTNNTNTKKHKG